MGLDLHFPRFLADKYIVRKNLYILMLCTSKSKQCKWPSISLVVWYISYNFWIPIPFLCSWILHGTKLKLCTSLLYLFINVSSCLAVIGVSMYLIDAFLIFMCSIYVYMFLPINVFMSLLRFYCFPMSIWKVPFIPLKRAIHAFKRVHIFYKHKHCLTPTALWRAATKISSSTSLTTLGPATFQFC